MSTKKSAKSKGPSAGRQGVFKAVLCESADAPPGRCAAISGLIWCSRPASSLAQSWLVRGAQEPSKLVSAKSTGRTQGTGADTIDRLALDVVVRQDALADEAQRRPADCVPFIQRRPDVPGLRHRGGIWNLPYHATGALLLPLVCRGRVFNRRNVWPGDQLDWEVLCAHAWSPSEREANEASRLQHRPYAYRSNLCTRKGLPMRARTCARARNLPTHSHVPLTVATALRHCRSKSCGRRQPSCPAGARECGLFALCFAGVYPSCFRVCKYTC